MLGISVFSPATAQTTIRRTAVAFVEADRSNLYIKQPDSAVQVFDLAAIFNQAVQNAFEIDSIRHLSIIGMTPDGSHFVLGGSIYFIDPSNTTASSFTGLFRIPWPLTAANILADPFFSNGKFPWFLLPSRNAVQLRPLGVLSPDGTEWWAVLKSVSDGIDSLVFYHGRTDGSGTIDSSVVSGTVTGTVALQDGYHMSNIAIDKSNKIMLATSFDALNSDQLQSGRFLFYRWNAGHGDVSATNFTGSAKTLYKVANGDQIDSVFGLTVIPENDGTNVLIGMTGQSNNTISLYQVPYNSGSISLGSPVASIPRSAIPSTQNFFAGRNCGLYKEDASGAENGQPGNGGDVTTNYAADSVLFITHESPFNCTVRDQNSGVWIYDRNSGTASLVYNDPNGQELQPVFITTPYVVPAPTQYPGIAWQTNYSGNFGTVDAGKTLSSTFIVIDTAKVSTVIDSVRITGPNANQFTVAPLSYPITLSPEQTQSFNITFKPIAPNGSRSAQLTVFFEGQTPIMQLTQSLSGTANVPVNLVEDPSLAQAVAIDPNPFNSIAHIQLTAQNAGALGIIVHDALGHEVYASPMQHVGAGASTNFDFNPIELSLPNGIYYVSAIFGNRQVSKQIIFIR